MGGRLTVKSVYGEGATFTLEIPKVIASYSSDNLIPVPDEDDQLSEEENNSTINIISSLDTNNYKILIVEDHPDMREFVQSIIGEHYQTRLAENGQEALNILEKEQIDFIISDVMMPIMDGFQLLEALKSDNRYRHLPVLMLTARAALEDKLNALRIGVDDYLTKPFIAEELLARIKNLLFNYKERQEWAKEQHAEALLAPEDAAVLVVEQEESSLVPLELGVTEEDQQWLQELEVFVKKTCGNNNFSVDWLAAELTISTRNLQRRLKKVTGLTPGKYINEVRLQLARELFETRKYKTIAQVSYHVGFQKTGYFTQLFVERFGITPSCFLEEEDS